MHRDPFTLRIALDSSLTAQGELYLDDGTTYAYNRGHLTWRGLSVDMISNGAELRLTNTDLALATSHSAVQGNPHHHQNNGGLSEFRSDNPFQTSIASVRVERVIVLGLPGKPRRVALEGNAGGSGGSGGDLEWVFGPGVAAVQGSGDGVASVLAIKDPGLGIATDWTIRITL
jgi:mannosyl-oligosaccharide alpha-1,3-glucosidase